MLSYSVDRMMSAMSCRKLAGAIHKISLSWQCIQFAAIRPTTNSLPLLLYPIVKTFLFSASITWYFIQLLNSHCDRQFANMTQRNMPPWSLYRTQFLGREWFKNTGSRFLKISELTINLLPLNDTFFSLGTNPKDRFQVTYGDHDELDKLLVCPRRLKLSAHPHSRVHSELIHC